MNTAVITGASSGLGRCYVDAVTKVFPEVEELWLIARREERLREIAQHYPDKRCVILPLDLADRRSYDILAEKLQQEQPQIKVFINDAGIAGGSPFETMELDKMLRIIDLNCIGATAVTRICLPYIVDGGTILEVSSTSAFVPNTNLVIYCASKSYVSSFCLGLREELRHRNINVCAMCPGLMLTEMNQANGNPHLTQGQSRLPVVDPKNAAVKSLKAAKRGRAVYTIRTKSPSGSKSSASCAFPACIIAPNLPFSTAAAPKSMASTATLSCPETQKAPASFGINPKSAGACVIHWAPVFLTPTHNCYSISMRLGLTGRAFCCCGAGSVMCRIPSSNFAWMSSFFTASPT